MILIFILFLLPSIPDESVSINGPSDELIQLISDSSGTTSFGSTNRIKSAEYDENVKIINSLIPDVPVSVIGPGGKPIQLIPGGPGSTPGEVTGPDGQSIKIVLPENDKTEDIEGPDQSTTPLYNIINSFIPDVPVSVIGPGGKPIQLIPDGPGSSQATDAGTQLLKTK